MSNVRNTKELNPTLRNENHVFSLEVKQLIAHQNSHTHTLILTPNIMMPVGDVQPETDAV